MLTEQMERLLNKRRKFEHLAFVRFDSHKLGFWSTSIERTRWTRISRIGVIICYRRCENVSFLVFQLLLLTVKSRLRQLTCCNTENSRRFSVISDRNMFSSAVVKALYLHLEVGKSCTEITESIFLYHEWWLLRIVMIVRNRPPAHEKSPGKPQLILCGR